MTKCNVCQHEVEIPNAPRNPQGQLSGVDYQRPAAAVTASKGNRLAARLIDLGLYVVLAFGIGFFQGFFGANPESFLSGSFIWMAFLALTVYQWYLLTAYGQTIGKQLMKIKIVKNDSKDNGGFVPNVLLREIVNGILSFIPLYALVDILFIFSAEERCIHDRIANTIVVSAEAPVRSLQPQQQQRPTAVAR
jgi:uncharacterized RDD family membrane protein YckC